MFFVFFRPKRMNKFLLNIFRILSMINIQYHLFEIKLRCFYLILSAIITFLICYNYQLEIVYIIGRPFIQLNQTFIFLELTEAFYTLIKISTLLTGVVIIPLIMYHFWCFFVPSLYLIERKVVNFWFVLFLILFIIELLFSYFFLLPKIFQFLLSFEMSSTSFDKSLELSIGPLVSVEFTARIACYVTLIVKIMMIVLVLFQIPFGVFLLYSKKLLYVSSFYLNRKYLSLLSLLVSALVVPPDVVSQLALAVLFYMIFEFLIFIGLFFEKKITIKNE